MTTTNNTSPADIRAINSLAEQDCSDDVDDSYARTGDAEDTIERWYASARQSGDRDLIDLVDRLGVSEAARIYEAARKTPKLIAAAERKQAFGISRV